MRLKDDIFPPRMGCAFRYPNRSKSIAYRYTSRSLKPLAFASAYSSPRSISLVGFSSAWVDRQRIKSFSRSDKSTINANDQSISKNGLSLFRLVSPPLVALVEVRFRFSTFVKSGFFARLRLDLSSIREQVLLSFSRRITTHDVEST